MAKLILKNGRNYGDASNYKDLLSRPTINTHLVEGEGATSGSLDIFKYISLEDYNDLLFKNPYALYAVCDEDNVIKNYFIHGSQTYSFTDYFQVSDLPEEGDPTVLYYLKEDTDTYGKGMWFWTQDESGEYMYVNIGAPDVDSKTIFVVPETGELNTQVDGYIVDYENVIEKNLITNKMPKRCFLSDDEKYTFLEFGYDYYFCYTPATTYKMSFNFSGDVVSSEIFPTDTKGTDNFIFEEDKFIMRLKASEYSSLEPSEYHLTLSWLEPQDISHINKLFLDIDEETIDWLDGVMHTDIVQNAYTSINGLDDYLYNVYYNNMDYPGAEKFFATHPNLSVLGGCTTVHSGDLTGRVYDNVYDESVEFVVETSNRVGRFATIGVASSIDGLTKDVVGNGDYSEMYEILPFMISEGINEHGLIVTSHIIKADKESGTIIRPEADKLESINSNAIPRYLLDNFRTAGEAVINLRDHVMTKVNQGLLQKGYVPAYMICDRSACYCVQLVEETYVVSTAPYLTNFYLWGTTPNTEGDPFYTPSTGDATVNGVTLHGQGLERYNSIAEVYDSLNNRAAMFDILKEVDYEKVYSEDSRLSDWCWLEDIQVNTPVDTILANSEVQRLKSAYASRTRDPEDPNYGTWHSKHRGVYNSLLKSLIITIQGIDNVEYKFSLSEDSVELSKMVLGEISDTEPDTSQNSILQILADCLWSEHRPTQINYNNETIVYGSPEIKEDFWGNTYFTLSNTLNGSFYILIRVYIDENHNVLSARRYEQYFGKYEELDPGVGSFLPVHSLVGFTSSSYVTFSGLGAFKIGTIDGWHGDGDLQYSTDKETWTSWDGLTPVAAVQQTSGKYEIYFRGEGGTTLNGTNFTMTPGNEEINLTLKGVLSTLIDINTAPDELIFSDGAFKNAFKNMGIFDISSLSFPKRAVNSMCESMFENCGTLTYIPRHLPEYIGNYGYKNTFKNTGITETPYFTGIQSIGIGAFEGCFSNCSKLTTIQKMPCEVLMKECYKEMFAHCTELVKVDFELLPSKTLAVNCYESMFEGCTSLSTPMRLYATNLKQECYKSMFKGCANIEFGDVGELMRVPYTGTGIEATDCCLDMFAGTYGDIPETTGTPLVNKEYRCIIKDFYFESTNPFTVECTSMLSGRKVEYSYDNITWSNWTGTLIAPPKTDGKHTVYFKGNIGPDVQDNTFGNFKVSSPTSDVDVIGNPTVLVGGNSGIKKKTFTNLFNGSAGLRSAKNLIMPQNLPTNSGNAFMSMFENCTHLVETPIMDFPNVNFGGWTGAFERMFYGCTNLVTQPDIHVNITAISIFKLMFANCTKLATVGKVEIDNGIDPASSEVFREMYSGCTSLTATPSLNYNFIDNTVPLSCFHETFKDCTSLTTIADFPTTPTKVYNSGFRGMFENTKVTTPVTLTAVPNTNSTYTYSRMFANCKNLTIPPTLPTPAVETTLYTKYTYHQMFMDSGLKTPPVINLVANVRDYQEMFKNCTVLEIPENYMLAKIDINGYSQYTSTFAYCTSITRPPKFDNITKIPSGCFSSMFIGCTSLKSAPDLSTITSLTFGSAAHMESMFEGCINLKIAPPTLPLLEVPNSTYKNMFKDTAISKPPEILATTGSASACEGMFRNCKNLKYPPDLYFKDYTYAKMCERMCSGCVSIHWVEVGSPYRLPATGSATSSYNYGCYYMFEGTTIDEGSEMPSYGTPAVNKTYYIDKPPEKLMWISSINEGEKLNQKYRFASGIYWCSNLDEGNWTNGGICYDPEATKIYFYGRCADNPISVTGDVTAKPEGDFTGVKPVGVSTIQHKVGGSFEALAITNNHDYAYLFDGFTSLVQIDPDIEWDDRGRYEYTFAYTGLTGLTYLPLVASAEFPSTVYKYKGTFQGCENLENVPEDILGAIEHPTSNGPCAYTCMFAYSGIKSIPALPTEWLPEACFAGMFMGTNLSETTEITLPGGGDSTDVYFRMFKDATFNENVVVHDMPNPIRNIGCAEEMFMNTNITNAPTISVGEDMYPGVLASMFKNCVNLKAPGTIHVEPNQYVGTLTFLQEMYDGCNFIWGPENMGIPYRIFDNDVVSFDNPYMFSNNEYITTMGECSMRTDGLIQDPNKTYWLFKADGYLTFSCQYPFSVDFAPYCLYSYNTHDWYSVGDSYTTIDAGQEGSEYKLYAKLMGVPEEATHGTRVIGGNKQVSVSGGLDGFYSCAGAFKDEEGLSDNGLYSAKNLVFDSELLELHSLQQMFKGCVNLVYPPENIGDVTSNAAITYKPKHFMEMFNGCESLITTVKKIMTPTQATPYLYAGMYENTAILNPPEEGIKVGADFAPSCCRSMFNKCKYLTQPAKLISTSDNPHAYSYTFATMYAECVNLSADSITDFTQYTFPEIYVDSTEVTESGEFAYYKTFIHCNSLYEKVCPIKTDTIANHACESMYEKCENLKNAQGALQPKSSTATTYSVGDVPIEEVTHSFYKMFFVCENLEVGSDALICNGVAHAWELAYNTCSSLQETPSIKSTTGAPYMYANTFSSCINLANCNSMPFDLAGDIAENSPYVFYETFMLCDELKEVPAINIDNGSGKKVAEHAFEGTFYYCRGLEEITFEKVEGDTQDNCFEFMFFQCESLKEIKGTNVWKINPSSQLVCESMFAFCKSLCMDYNFKITQLTAGDAKWTGVGLNAFSCMFDRCSKLYIPIVFEFEHNPTGVTYNINDRAFYRTFAETSIVLVPENAGGIAYILPYNTDIEGVQYGLATFEECVNYDIPSGIVGEHGNVMLGKIFYYDKSIPTLDEYVTFDGVWPYKIELYPGMWYRNGDSEWTRVTQHISIEAAKSDELSAEAGRDVYAVRVTHPAILGSGPRFSVENNYAPSWAGGQVLDAKVKVYGELATILNWEEYKETSPDILPQYTDCDLMYGDILDASKLIMPDEIVKEVDGVTYVRFASFRSETLQHPPEVLPATKLYPHCYDNMFNGCKAMVRCPAFVGEGSAPNELELAPYCFKGMFCYCESLRRGPRLPEVEELPVGSYEYMFEYTGLEYAPEIPVSSVVRDYGCYCMFRECRELLRADEIPEAPSVGRCGYYSMYKGCVKANRLGDLGHITTIGDQAMEYMYYGIKGIKWHDDGSGLRTIKMCDANAQVVGYPFVRIFVDTGGEGSDPPPASGGIVVGTVYRYDSIE